MFQWNAEKVRFMEDAAAWGDFHARLAAEMAPYLPRDGHVCDAGCGTGHLALALAPYVKRVTAVDVSAQALALLTENCRKRGAANIDIRCGDIARLPPEQPYALQSWSTASVSARSRIPPVAPSLCEGRHSWKTARIPAGEPPSGFYAVLCPPVLPEAHVFSALV